MGKSGLRKSARLGLQALLALGISTVSQADAPDWELVSTSEAGVSVYLDINSVTVEPVTVHAWIKFVPSARSNVPFRDAVARWRIDCEADTQATISATSYGPNGEVRSTETNDARPGEPIVPGSYSATVRDLLCPLRRDRVPN
ncbi:surface-adhesin E family protein [Sphingomonas sabuli]|uniref:surface-adhesin E family protein n=1 Tax=Sphingomonas sabuli TaxID=2764186 RepID=UPI003CCD74B5